MTGVKPVQNIHVYNPPCIGTIENPYYSSLSQGGVPRCSIAPSPNNNNPKVSRWVADARKRSSFVSNHPANIVELIKT